MSKIHVYENDLPDTLKFDGAIAVDTETMGLNPHRDRLCLVQISGGDGEAHLVKFDGRNYAAPNLKALLSNKDHEKIFHFARFDIGVLRAYLQIDCAPVFCTKIASRLCRTYTDKHGLKEVVREITGKDLDKQQQSSDWGADELSKQQQIYAANDVLYLHEVRDALAQRLEREGRMNMARACFSFLPARAALDLTGWPDTDIFAH